MTKTSERAQDPAAPRRPRKSHPLASGIECRAGDGHPAKALYFVAIVFRVMSGLLLLLMIGQVVLGLMSAVQISLGVLLGEALRLFIFAGLIWAAGDVADVLVKSHCDILAMRILLTKLTSDMSLLQTPSSPIPPPHVSHGRHRDEQPH